MIYNSADQLSKYIDIAPINEAHGVYLVMHEDTSRMYVKKVMTVYSRRVFDVLKVHNIPGTPKIAAISESEGVLTVIEEYIEGQTLSDYLCELGGGVQAALTQSEAAEIILEVCQIVKLLHSIEPPVIHRDIKPSNIMITPEKKLYLIDFNAAKFVSGDKSEDTVLLGTHGYAAPEQYGFGESGIQTDIYSLGVLFRELLAGPDAKDAKDCGDFSEIIAKATKIDPAGRFRSVELFAGAIAVVYCRLAEPKIESFPEPVDFVSEKPATDPYDSFIPPGFRTGNRRHMIIGGLGYLFILWQGITFLSPTNTLVDIVSTKVFFTLICLTIVGCLFNYRNVWSRMPLTQSRHFAVRAAGVLILTVCSLMALFLITIFVVMALGG